MDVLAGLLGKSPAMEALRDDVRRLLGRGYSAHRPPSILIQGHTGSGKGLLAGVLHAAGPRASGPFVDVNCAAIPETLLESELFGYERGAFTDARRSKPGLFQTAHRGTIFLDEVGLLAEALQAKLLKVLEERAVRRLGGTHSEAVDVWVISASNVDLPAAIRKHEFREDLYHRLAVLTLRLPPLRERGEDILLLANHFLARAAADYGVSARTLSPDACARLMSYSWPGNVRELGNLMERVALLSETPQISAAMLNLSDAPAVASPVLDAPAPNVPAWAQSMSSDVGSLDHAMADHIRSALEQTGWNLSRTAARLGIARNTLRVRIEKLGLRQGGAKASAPQRAAPRPPRPVAAAAPAPAAPSAPAAAAPAPAPSEAPEVATAAVSPVSAASAVPSVRIRWERRRVTLLRARLMVPAGTDALMDTSRALETLIEKIRSLGGRVEELSPTSVGAAFGLDLPEDAPRRAAHAAMAMRKALERSGLTGADQFPLKIAIHVGVFLVGRTSSGPEIDSDTGREGWATLESLLASAPPWSIVASAEAAPFLERRFDLEPQSSENDATPRAYWLAGPERAGFKAGGRMAAFVNRKLELELLRSRLASVRAGHVQIVGISGEAGIGKSRLLFEFRQTLRGRRVTLFEGRCRSYGATIPYLPILELLRRACRLADPDGPEVVHEKVSGTLGRLGLEAAEGAPYLLRLLGIKEGAESLEALSPESVQQKTFELLRRMIRRGGARQPLILVLEDVHWIDHASEAFASVMDGLAGVPLLVLLTYRPGYRPPWTDRANFTQIALHGLSEDESTTMVGPMLAAEAVLESLCPAIVAKADGNPFFLEELARVAVEQGSALQIPDTVEEVLLARIDRLSPAARGVLQHAAVLGPEVLLPLLRAVLGDPDDIEPNLAELSRLEFLYERHDGDEPTYVFAHGLTQEVAYRSLTEIRRRAAHAAAGFALEDMSAGRIDEVVELLAYHFDRSTADEKAVDYALLAAVKAQRRWANAEAVAHFEAALRRLDSMKDTQANRLRRIDAVVDQAEVQFALGHHAEHVRALEAIRGLVDRTADPRRRAAWYYWTGFLHSLTGTKPEVAIAYCREAVAIADAGGFEELRAYAECCLGQVYYVAGDLRDALEAGERALAVFERRGNVWWACRTLWVLNTAALYLGDWARGLDYCRRALAHGQAVDDLRLKVVGWFRMGSTYVHRGEHLEGLRCIDEAQALSPIEFDAAMIKIARGHALIKAGKAASAIPEMGKAVAWFERSHLSYGRAMGALRLAEGHLRAGDRSSALTVLDSVLAVSRELGYRYFEGRGELLLAECLLVDDLDAATEHLAVATKILTEVGARNDLGKALVVQAEVRRRAHDFAGARSLLERALKIFEELGTLDEISQTRLALARLDR
jgi:DNA-binding NtrC family response regulator/tetratricopeptide (TPR) repeat protein